MTRRFNCTLLLLALLITPVLAADIDPPLPVRDAAYDQKMAWWREARFGCFVHWGPSVTLGNVWRGKRGRSYAEHIQRALKISMADYQHDAIDHFNPTGFDAEAWMALVKRAGMRYFVITAKHHDGFAMYDSQVSDYNIVKASPWHHDPMKDLAAAARRQGVHFGFYYSHAYDWGDKHAPGNDWEWGNVGGDLAIGGVNWWENNAAKVQAVRRDYVDAKAIPQIKELLRNYRPDLLWFDTPFRLPFSENYHIMEAVRAADPRVIINGRLARKATGNYGDYVSTGDRSVQFMDLREDWEAIPTTNEAYGWNPFDLSHKSPSFLLKVVARAVSRGGNILLNIGPMADGRIDPRDVAILEGIGQWMDLNSDSIHGCGRAGLPVQPWGVITAKGQRQFLHVFDWPKSALVIGALASTPVKAWIQGDNFKTPLPISRVNTEDVALQLPARPKGAAHPVIILEFAETPRGGGVRLLSAALPANQLLTFDATWWRGEKTGRSTGLGAGDGKIDRYYITGWDSPEQFLSWDFRLNEPAAFEVVLNYTKGTSTGVYAVACGDWSASRRVSPDAKTDVAYPESLGVITLPAGVHRIELRALKIEDAKKGNEIFRPLDLQLRPVVQQKRSGATADANPDDVDL